LRLSRNLQVRAAENRYAELFGRYVMATDAKRVIGDALAGLLSGCKRPVRVLDMGAGRGEISAILAETADVVDAVEPNRRHYESLVSLALSNPRIRVSEGSVQEFRSDTRYDLIALVYVVESIVDSDLASHVARLLDMRKPDGRVVGVTYVDGCPWDAFSSAVESIIPFGSTGGVSRVFPRLRAGGLNVRNIGVVSSSISAPSVEELFEVLSFFYMKELHAYERSRRILMRELGHYVEGDGDGVRLTVDDVLYEITPMTFRFQNGSGLGDQT